MEWNAFIDKAKNATFLFNRNFIEYHNDRFQDYSLMIYQNEVLVAVLPAHQKTNEIFSHSGLTYGGMVVQQSLKFENYMLIWLELLKFLENEEITTLHLKELPNFYCEFPSEELQYTLFKLGAITSKKLMYSCIAPTKISLSKDRKAGVQRGNKNELRIEETDDFSEFWNTILIPNLQSKHQAAPVHSLEEVTRLKTLFPSKIRQFNVYKNDLLVAGTTIFETALIAHSQYISGNSDKNSLGSLDLLHHHLIANVFKDKEYFDFGTSHEDGGATVNKGLLYWKEGFGARSFVQNHYTIAIDSYHNLKDVFV